METKVPVSEVQRPTAPGLGVAQPGDRETSPFWPEVGSPWWSALDDRDRGGGDVEFVADLVTSGLWEVRVSGVDPADDPTLLEFGNHSSTLAIPPTALCPKACGRAWLDGPDDQEDRPCTSRHSPSLATTSSRARAPQAPDEAELAAVAFLARYSGRTLDAYRHPTSRTWPSNGDIGCCNKPALIPLVPRTARTIDLAVGERRAHRWVRSIGKRAGIGTVYPHMLRAAFIMAALDAGVRSARSRSPPATPILEPRPCMTGAATTLTSTPLTSWSPSSPAAEPSEHPPPARRSLSWAPFCGTSVTRLHRCGLEGFGTLTPFGVKASSGWLEASTVLREVFASQRRRRGRSGSG